jgi:hypothetical protein
MSLVILLLLLCCAAGAQQPQSQSQYPKVINLGPAPTQQPSQNKTTVDNVQHAVVENPGTQIPVKIRVAIVDRDLNPKPVPKARIIVKQANSPTPTRFEMTTDFEGIAKINIHPGTYRLISADPTDFQGKSYNWDVEVTVTESQNSFDLSNDNAQVADLAPPPVVVDSLASIYKKYRNSVVTVLAEYWGFFRRRSAIFCEGDQQFCDSDQESERSDAGFGIVSEVIGMVKEKVEEFDLEQGMRGGRRGQRLRPLFPHPPWRRLLGF